MPSLSNNAVRKVGDSISIKPLPFEGCLKGFAGRMGKITAIVCESEDEDDACYTVTFADGSQTFITEREIEGSAKSAYGDT
jgi:hypothetical protein